MATETIQAELRTEFGKGAARRIRRADMVPAVVYGHGNEPIHLSLPGHEVMLALKHGGANSVVTLRFDGNDQLALTKQIQADPIRGFIEHVDFVAVRRGEKVTVEVLVHVVGEPKSDAMVVTEVNVVTVEAEATHIPERFEVSVEDAEVGYQVFARDLDVPSGVSLLTEADHLVLHLIHAPTQAEVEAELEEAEAEAGIERDESVEGAEAAAAATAEGAEGADEGESGGDARSSDEPAGS